jgi:thermostable 8-oxoguanine DNA glycosylase
MIDPRDVTRYDRSTDELWEFWLFSLMVAGKNARVIAEACERFVQAARTVHGQLVPVPGADLRTVLRDLHQQPGRIRSLLEAARTGKYVLLTRALFESRDLDLRTCTVPDLEQVYGVGPKTARFFLLHTRPDQRLAVLDTHILAHLRTVGLRGVPYVTPAHPTTYRLWELVVLGLAGDAGLTPAAFDLWVWNQRSKNGRKEVRDVAA